MQPLNEVEPLEGNPVCFKQVEQGLKWFSVYGHEMIVRVVLEESRPSFEDMAVVLDQSFRPGVSLMHLALRAIAREEPVVPQCSCVLLVRDPDALSRLPLESLQLSGSNC